VRDARVAPDDLVVDVGAGSGMLTRPLLAAGARVVAVEPDAALAARLRRACPAARVVAARADRFRWPDEPFRVVANLPFAHSTEILRALLADPALPLRSLDAVVQWELALKRTRLWPSSFQAVLWSTWFELEVVRRLPPAAFAPPPSVAAAVLRASRRAEPLVPAEAAAAFASFLGRGYREGTLRRVVPTFAALADGLGLDRGATARDLDARQWAALFRSVRRRR
jgi:23S rRNA (adenine-N6)-dimethyltransferase